MTEDYFQSPWTGSNNKTTTPRVDPALSVSSADDGSDVIFTMMEEVTLQKKTKVNKANIIWLQDRVVFSPQLDSEASTDMHKE